MKIQIDTKAKSLKIESDITMSELVDFLDKILPGEWKSYKLETNTVIHKWSSPIVIDRRTPYWLDEFRWNPPYYTTCGSTTSIGGNMKGSDKLKMLDIANRLGTEVLNIEVN